MADEPIKVEYFSDIFCVWAYGAQIRLDELENEFGDKIDIVYRFIPIFGAAHHRIQTNWENRGGFDAFSAYVRDVAKNWDHVLVSDQVWRQCRPASSVMIHLFLKAIQLLVEKGEVYQKTFEVAVWRAREMFFKEAKNVCRADMQHIIAKEMAIPFERVQALIDNGEAYAALHLDNEYFHSLNIPGSPTIVLNEGRQTLYGNLGYRLLKANIDELLHDPQAGEASWC